MFLSADPSGRNYSDHVEFFINPNESLIMDMKIYRVLALPEVIEAGALYLLRNAISGQVEVHVASSDGQSVSRALTKEDVEGLITAATPESAEKLTTARTISATGDATWEVSFDGSANATAAITLADSGATAGEYGNITIDSKGRVTAVRALTGNDVGRGALNGVASLVDGLVPASQLPSYVDDVIEVEAFDQLPGELSDPGTNGVAAKGKIYVVAAAGEGAGDIYRWSGTTYIAIPTGVGTADSALKLTVARNIAATGDATWSIDFDGSADVTAAITLADTAVTAGTYGNITVDSKGRLTAARDLIEADIPQLTHIKVLSAASVYIGTPEW